MTTREQERRAEEAAGLYLEELLRRPGSYRDLWERYAHYVDPRQVSQAAVAEVVALYLWEAGLRPDDDTNLPRKLKDRISRALSGGGLSPETLGWLIEAFDVSDGDAERLRALRQGYGGPQIIRGRLPEPTAPGFREPEHETILLHEHHFRRP